MDDAVATASRAAGYDGGVRAITIDGPAFHNLGACASWELAGSVAAGVAYLRLLGDGGLSIRDALRQSSFRFAADDDQFMIIATLRAARQLWARVAAVAGEPDGGAATVHAVTSVPMMAQRDPWVNMLRTTLATGFSRRISRNTQLLLEECHIGRVLDPVAGSWFVEDLTEQLAQQAWEHFQAIEERGGFVEARGFIAEQIEEVRAPAGGRRRAPAHGADRCQRIPEPRGTTATARGFDVHPRALRGRFREAAGPLGCLPGKVRGAAAGAAASARPARRAQHPRDVRGEPARVGRDRGGQPRNRHSRRCRGAVSAAGSPTVAVVCGTDARCGTDASGVVESARGAGLSQIYRAGPQKAVADVDEDGRPDDYLTAKIDAVEALSTLLTRLGA